MTPAHVLDPTESGLDWYRYEALPALAAPKVGSGLPPLSCLRRVELRSVRSEPDRVVMRGITLVPRHGVEGEVHRRLDRQPPTSARESLRAVDDAFHDAVSVAGGRLL